MRWPWAKTPPTDDTQGGGAEARDIAEAALADHRSRWEEVHRVSSSLRELRTRNHFARQLELIFRGERGAPK